MADATTVAPQELEAGASSLEGLSELAGSLGRELELKDFRSGRWFNKLAGAYLRHHEARTRGLTLDPKRCEPAATRSLIQRACVETALTGAGAASVATGATLFIADTGPLSALLAVPVAGLAIGGELLLRTLIHLRLSCDLATAFDRPFRAENPEDLARLYALVFETAEHEDPRDPGRGLVNRLLHSDLGQLGEDVGSRLLGESLVRNVVPVAGVVASSVTNWRRTERVGQAVLEYVRARRALGPALDAVLTRWDGGLELVLESAWFLFIADGQLDTQETAILMRLFRRVGPQAERRLLERLVEDESAWLHRLRQAPEEARDVLLRALETLSAVNMDFTDAERRRLRSAAAALERPYERHDVDRMIEQLRAANVLPPAPRAPARTPGKKGKKGRKKQQRERLEVEPQPWEGNA